MRFPTGRAEIHVWIVDLDVPAEQLPALYDVLGPDEAARARAFQFRRDLRRFVAGRAHLRGILGRYLDRPPSELRFHYEAHGKPRLQDAWRADIPLRFNVSHSRDIELVAVASGHDVGVDVEAVRADVEWSVLAERFFSVGDAHVIAALPPDAQSEGFYRCWTRKEAFVKGLGEGVSEALQSFSVLPASDPVVRIHDGPHPMAPPGRWRLADVDPGPGFVGAVAAPTPFVVTCRAWDGAVPPAG